MLLFMPVHDTYIACCASLSSSLEMLNVVPSCCNVSQKCRLVECDMVLLVIECKKICINRFFVLRTMDKHISNG